MITCVTCTTCQKATHLPFTLKWLYDTEYCKDCNNREEKIIEYNFCSAKCMQKWVNDFTDHKCKWTKDPIMPTERKMCLICRKRKWNKK